MTKPITDKVEIALEYPDKLYVGSFERSSRFDAHFDEAGVAIVFNRPGSDDAHKSVHIHIHYGLFADILRELSATAPSILKDDEFHRDQLKDATTKLLKALEQSHHKSKK